MLDRLLRESAEELKALAIAYVGSEMDMNTPVSETAMDFVNNDRLQVRSTALFRSFENDSQAEYSSTQGLTATIESTLPYAEIQDKGGFIKATPVTVLATRKQTYKMAQHFWARFYNSQNEFFKIMALSVQKKGGVNIKAKKYFSNAMTGFKNEGFREFANDIFIPKMVEYWFSQNENDIDNYTRK